MTTTNSAIPKASDPLPTGEEKAKSVQALFDAIAPRYDLVNRLMTFGLDVTWRRKTMKMLSLKPGSLVADLACGTGDFCREIRQGGHVPVGFDLALGMLQAARTDAQLVHADALRLPVLDASFDAVTCGFALRNFVALDGFFDEVARITRSGGRIAFLDVSAPSSPLLRGGFDFYFGRVVPKIGGLLSNADAYEYLPRSVAYLPERDELVRLVETAGFTDVEHHQLTGGLTQLIIANRA